MLRERDFRLLLTGQTLSNLGSALVPIALAFAILDLTGSATDLGPVLLASRLPNLVLVLAGGVVADRLPRRWVMLASDARPVSQRDPASSARSARESWSRPSAPVFVLSPAVAARIGVDATLWIGAVWVIVSTAALLTVPGIRTLRRRDTPEIIRSTSTAR